jgi:hypothetical protein
MFQPVKRGNIHLVDVPSGQSSQEAEDTSTFFQSATAK